ncbi:MAG TPA: hypothetical protein VK186_28340, partial [Candidatus Deferrimicrobium sp.]|nr:hypothetical protein [Candidatus Deferrimicrobium sp.]
RDWGNSLLKKVFQADCVTQALDMLERTPEEEIEAKVLMHFKDYFVNHPDQPSALEILMDSNNYTKDKQVQIIKNAYEIAKVWVKGGGVDHINFHAPGSGQKPAYIGIDGNDIVKRKEFLDIVENIKGPGEITQPLDIGESNKAHIVFYNELAGITAFYPHSISAQGGMKQRYNEFYTNSKLFDPENQEELHTDKNRFQFNDLIPKTDEETFRYKAAIRAFVLSRLLGMMRVEDNEFGGDTFEQIYCYEYRDPFDNNVKEVTLGNELNAIDMLYRDTSKNDSWRVQILDNVEEAIRVIIQKKMLAQYLLLIEFYLREVYPFQSDQLKERGDMVITRYSPQYAILEHERRRIYEKVLVDSQSKKQVITALNSLRGKTDDKGMRYNDYAEALKPFTKESGKFERVEETMVGEFKSVYYEAFALDFSKLGLLKEKIVEPQMKKTRLIDEEATVEEEKAMGPESMNRPCPVCKTEINVRAIYCIHCQNTVSQHLTCTRCGEDKVPSDLKACWKCGNPMVREEKIDCPRCYSFKGYKREFPCKVCGFNFEAENPGSKKTSTAGDSSRQDKDDKKNTGQTGTAGTKENFSEEKKNRADAGTEKEEIFQSSDQKSQAGEKASASLGEASSSGINDEVVECQNCFSQVKKGPRCPVCQAPLNLSY